MKTHRMILFFALLAVLMAGCAQPGAVLVASPTPEPTVAPSPQPTDEPTAEPTEGAPSFTVTGLEGLDPLDVVLQYAYEPTFFLPHAMYPFGRVPFFTLYANGLLIYVEEGDNQDTEQAMQVQLTPEETAALVQQALDMGIARLESYSEMCFDAESGQECIADAAYTIFRVRLPDGELHEARIYANFTPEREAFEQVMAFLGEYENPDAVPFRPEQAALFLMALEPGAETGQEVQEWPLERDLLADYPEGEFIWAYALQAEELDQMLAAMPSNMGRATFERDGVSYQAYLVPWLPGAEYEADLLAEFPPAS